MRVYALEGVDWSTKVEYVLFGYLVFFKGTHIYMCYSPCERRSTWHSERELSRRIDQMVCQNQLISTMIAVKSDSWIYNEKHENGNQHSDKCRNVDKAPRIEQSSALYPCYVTMRLLWRAVYDILVIKEVIVINLWIVSICDKAPLSLKRRRIFWVAGDSEDRFTRCWA